MLKVILYPIVIISISFLLGYVCALQIFQKDKIVKTQKIRKLRYENEKLSLKLKDALDRKEMDRNLLIEYGKMAFEYKRELEKAYKTIDVYKSELKRYKSEHSSNNDIVNDAELKAIIKKLMIYSHPDKGICKDSNDFIKYKEMYDKFK